VANLIVSAVSTFDNKGLKKGQKEIGAFDKQVNKLGKTFAGVFGAAAILNYGKKAISAFMADEKAAKSLELQLKNTGYAFSAPAVEDYIGKLQRTTGVLDDELRPAFQKLLTVTSSITQSQEALALALDLSAAGYGSVEQISTTLAKAYAGQTTALGKLGTGLSKATLKTGNMQKIMAELNQKFAGQSAARLETYAGQMDLLKVGAANASEEIGKGLLDALSLLSKDKSIEDAASDMESFGKSIGDAIYGLALLISKLDGLAKKTKTAGLADLLTRLQPGGKGASILAGALSVYGSKNRNKPASNFTYDLGPSATKDIERANKLLKEKNKLAADELKKLKAKSEVDKLKDKFDVERIGLMKALGEATDAETKLRLNAKIAILDNNEALSKKYNAELDAAAKTKLLADSLTKAGLAVDAFSNFAMGAVQRGEYADAYKNISNVPTQSVGGAMQLPSAATFAMGGVSRGEYAPVTVNVAGSVLTEQDLTNTINETLLRINKMGRGTTPAGGLSGGT